MTDLHAHYDRLSPSQRAFVDALFDREVAFAIAAEHGVTLNGCDPAERAVDAVAQWVLESEEQTADTMQYPHVVRNVATGRDVYSITAERFWKETLEGPAPWVDAADDRVYLLDPERLEGQEGGWDNALREIVDVGRKLEPNGKIRLSTMGADVLVSRNHPIYVGAR